MKTKIKRTEIRREAKKRGRALASFRKMIAEAKSEAKPGRRKWRGFGHGLPEVDERPQSRVLLDAIRARLPALKKLLDEFSGHWSYEDPVYRFYHQSFKVYGLQDSTKIIVAALQDLMPDRKLNDWFTEIVARGTGKTWMQEHNKHWVRETSPIVEAFFHARYFLDMAVRYGRELKKPPTFMPSGWAALLYLYGLR
jgi:hypothetical protein